MSEACGLDLDDIKWDLGRFGKLHVRHGKGARGSGPRERMVPLINGADRTLRWFIEDVWGQFDDDHTRPGAPLLPSERKNADGSSRRVGDDALRGGLKDAAKLHLPGWEEKLTPHVLRHFWFSAKATAGQPPAEAEVRDRLNAVRHHQLFVTVLEEMGIFLDDSEPSFERWLSERLDGFAPGIAAEAERWTRVLRDGGPRSLPRQQSTVWLYLNGARPALLGWSDRYDHLREATREDVLTHLKTLHGHHRRDRLGALRSLFAWAKRSGLIFRNPPVASRSARTSTACSNRSHPARSTAPSRLPPPRPRDGFSPSPRCTPPGSPR
ncbi:site-specific integrase [Streptomyces sp. NPDC005790]|uniref:site-specific integrase n=2 Tax=unclassified Streptomyces TaxID=2593676 RepID=UPI0033FDB463